MLAYNPLILVCGGRKYRNRAFLYYALDKIADKVKGTMIILEGGAKGADRLAREYAIERGYHYMTIEAEWDKYGKRAGMLRNTKMAELKPDLCVAFTGGPGTNNMVQQAQDHKIKIVDLRKLT